MLIPMILCLALICPSALSMNLPSSFEEKNEDRISLELPDEPWNASEENSCLDMLGIQLSMIEFRRAQRASDGITKQMIKDAFTSAMQTMVKNLANTK